jgi:hypothetical protein
MKTSQKQKILKHLSSGKSLSPLQALGLFGCYRLAGRIYDLKRAGHQIGQKAFQDDLRADRVAIIRTVWVVLHIVTCVFIIAHNGIRMNLWSF